MLNDLIDLLFNYRSQCAN